MKRSGVLRRRRPLRRINAERAARRRARYKAYLGSKNWRQLRALVLERAAYCCERCGEKPQRLEINHKTYSRFGHENLDDLEALCKRCHERYHTNGVYRRSK